MEEIKDLGGLVNKDLAFSKLPQGAVFDSQNFRITTNDGNTSAARESIRGTVAVVPLSTAPPATTCYIQIVNKDTLINTIFPLLIPGASYDISFNINGVPVTSNFSFTYTATTNSTNDADFFLDTLGTYISNNADFTNALVTVIAPRNSMLVQVPCGTTITASSFTITNPTADVTRKPFEPFDPEFQISCYTAVPAPNCIGSGLYLSDIPSYALTPLWAVWEYEGNQFSGPPWAGTRSDVTEPLLASYSFETFVERMGQDVYNFSGSVVTSGDTVVEVGATDAHDSRILLYGEGSGSYDINYAQAISNPGYTPGPLYNKNLFTYGPYNAELSFYVRKTSALPVTIKIYFDPGISDASQWGANYLSTFGPAGTGDIEYLTSAGSTGPQGILIQSINIPAGVTNYDSLNNSAGSTSFTFSIPSIVGVNPAQSIFGSSADDVTTNLAFNYWIEVSSVLGSAADYSVSFDYLKIVNTGITSANLSSYIVPSAYSIPPTAPIKIIGWVALRDDIYIFTTDGTFDPDNSPGVPPVTNDAIWKVLYDKGGNPADPNNYILGDFNGNAGIPVWTGNAGFTIYRPIANPGMIESRYENSLIQKIYWTDNYNVPRQINVADPNVGNLTVEQLNLLPSLSMDLPVFVNIQDGGSLKVGLYQVAYRLKNTNGSETRFSRTTNFIPVIDAQEGNNPTVQTYYPRKLVTEDAGKQIIIRVDNIDTNFDTIEFVTLYYKDNNNQPEILIVKEAFISGSSVEVIITGDEDPVVPITIEEFTAFTTSIKRAKTLAAKKQTLFLANVTTGDQVINFDARTYRFPINDNTTYIQYENNQGAFESVVYDSATGDFNYLGTPNNPVPETHDCLQAYVYQGPTVDTNYLFQPNSNILGGAGPNVKYEFFTENVKLDNKYDDSPASGAYGPHMTPDTNAGIAFNSVDRTFVSQGTSLSNNASPYVYDLFVGYRRDEMYRFGIVFFDELDNPTYVSWIGDIRMPHIFMPATCRDAYLPGAGTTRTRLGVGINPTNGLCTDTTYLDEANNKHDLYGKPLGIKFTIDFSSVPSQYKKASIVRVPLKPEYKHVIGQGYLQPTFISTSMSGSPYANTNTVFTQNGARGNYAWDPVPIGSGNYNGLWYDCWTLASPEFLFDTFQGFTSSDAVDVLGLLYKSDFAFLAGEVGGGLKPLDSEPFSSSSGQQNKRWTGFRIKNYELNEGASTPSSIKSNISNNPYGLINAFVLNRAGVDGSRKYTGPASTIQGAGSTLAVRSVHHCVPKNLNGFGGGLNYGTNANPGYSYGNNTLFVQMLDGEAYNFADPSVSSGGGDFIQLDGWKGGSQYFFHNYLGNYKKNVASPFGGQNYFARSSSEYVPCNNLIDISNKSAPITTKVLGGDTSVVVMDYVLQFFDRAEAGEFDNNNRVDIFFKEVYFPVETSIAVDYRRTYNNLPYSGQETSVPNKTRYLRILYGAQDSQWNSTPTLPIQEEFTVDPVFNHTDKSVYRYFPQPALIVPPTVYDCRIWKSEPKNDGELVESWSVFKPSAFKDVESAYGPINNLLIFQDKLFFFQDRGFGVVQVAAQQLLNSSDGDLSELVLGSSGILERYDYISTKTGTKHQFSMSVSDYSMIWFDSLARKIYKYSPSGLAPLSDLKGYSAYVYARTGGNFQNFDNPYIGRGIHSTYDYRHGEFYMTFLDDDFQDTLVYSDFFDGFVGSYTHYPKVYINDKVNIFGVVTSPVTLSDTIHIHNYGPYGKFYDNVTYDDSKVSFVVNSNPTIEKVFTNLEIVAESYKANLTGNINYDSLSAIDYTDFFDTIRVYDNYQNTDVLSTTGLSRRHKTIWNVKVPSDRVLDVTQNIFNPVNLALNRPAITRRMKDKWFVVDLTYSNQLTTGQNKFVAHSAKALYSVNSR
jgi:hypothetical protein